MGFRSLDANGSIKATRQPTEITITTTGNIDNLDFSNADLIRMNNASLATIRGLKAGTAGQKVTIVSVGAGQVDQAHQDTNSAASARLINMATVGKTSLAPGVGSSTYQYDGTTARWRLVDHFQGATIDVAYAGGNFTAKTAGTWTVDSGDQITFCYSLSGRLLTVIAYLDTTSVVQSGASPNVLLVSIPGGFVAAKKMQGLALGFDNGVSTSLFNRVSAGDTTIEVGRGDAAQWANATNNTYVRVHFVFEVQ